MFRQLLPFIIVNAKTAPLVAFGIAYGLTWLYHPSILVAIAATGGAALLNKITDVEPPEPTHIRLPHRQRTAPSRADRISL